ncbi:MAG: hypothetical protein FD154_1381 [Elusimicrobia bacterium]|nr:MAG: hypothetical protein FD154_1381 [Elusimicrobiota bacterium]
MLFSFQPLAAFRLRQIIFSGNNTLASFLFQILPGFPRYASAFDGSIPVGRKTPGIIRPGDSGCGRFTQHGEDKLQIRHVVAQIFPLKPFDFFMGGWSHPESGLCYFRSQNFILFGLFNVTFFPLIGQFFAYGNAAHPFFYPFIRIAFSLEKSPRPFCGKFGVLYLLHPLITDFCQPAFERLGFWGRDGLNYPENSLSIGAVSFVFFTVRGF